VKLSGTIKGSGQSRVG